MASPYQACNIVQNILTNISTLGNARTLKLENCLRFLSSTIPQFFDFIRCMIFDFIFHCVTTHSSIPSHGAQAGLHENKMASLMPRKTAKRASKTTLQEAMDQCKKLLEKTKKTKKKTRVRIFRDPFWQKKESSSLQARRSQPAMSKRQDLRFVLLLLPLLLCNHVHYFELTSLIQTKL